MGDRGDPPQLQGKGEMLLYKVQKKLIFSTTWSAVESYPLSTQAHYLNPVLLFCSSVIRPSVSRTLLSPKHCKSPDRAIIHFLLSGISLAISYLANQTCLRPIKIILWLALECPLSSQNAPCCYKPDKYHILPVYRDAVHLQHWLLPVFFFSCSRASACFIRSSCSERNRTWSLSNCSCQQPGHYYVNFIPMKQMDTFNINDEHGKSDQITYYSHCLCTTGEHPQNLLTFGTFAVCSQVPHVYCASTTVTNIYLVA